MNEEDCNNLADSYEKLMEDNMQRLTDSKDRQYRIKNAAFSLKGGDKNFMEYSDDLRD